MNNKIEKLSEIIKYSDNIVFFGGAGVSTASGIPDFRSAEGLFNEKLNAKFTPEELVSHSFFVKYPEDFFDFYKDKLIYEDAKPNHCHTALAKLENLGKLKAVVTQNIDGLHQKAGSKNVLELHGSVLRNYCIKCGEFFDEKYIVKSNGIPYCNKCGAIVKPDVVLYGESLDSDVIAKTVYAIENADVLIIGGTSLVVYPAAGFINYFKGSKIVLINKSRTFVDSRADLAINADISEVFKQCMELLDI